MGKSPTVHSTLPPPYYEDPNFNLAANPLRIGQPLNPPLDDDLPTYDDSVVPNNGSHAEALEPQQVRPSVNTVATRTSALPSPAIIAPAVLIPPPLEAPPIRRLSPQPRHLAPPVQSALLDIEIPPAYHHNDHDLNLNSSLPASPPVVTQEEQNSPETPLDLSPPPYTTSNLNQPEPAVEPPSTSKMEEVSEIPKVREELLNTFLAKHKQSYTSGLFSFFHKTQLTGFYQNNANKPCPKDLIAHAKTSTFFGNKNRTRLILEEMGIMDTNGAIKNPNFK